MTDSASGALTGKKLLIVEDDWLLQNLLSTKLTPLTEQGVLLSSAFDGDKAVEMAKASRPDVILLDILLPGMTGFEFLETMQKADPSFRDVPVIVFTNLNSEEDREHAKKLGVRDFMPKADSTIDDIAKRIESVLGETA
jgi:CheY-like chemotaxis protein